MSELQPIRIISSNHESCSISSGEKVQVSKLQKEATQESAVPENIRNEVAHLLAVIDEIKELSDSFPYIPSSEDPSDRNYWIEEPTLEHWNKDFDTWNAEWGVMSRENRINGYPAQISVTGPSKDIPRISVEICPDYGGEGMTFEKEKEAENDPAFRDYEFEVDGKISKKRYFHEKPTVVEEMLPGDYEIVGFVIGSIKNALIKAKS